ncbi:hypothetical protein HanXRQr2_Chr10g0451831 [Helianthus annuus]|uniref:Uncharacterized protein n=1 Tax=Helianthus annuus TaxID=4232 RepID=A0A9K3N5M3_HELAN|nr:hypothetical protein HanXRQr2_Chr10g0451831 [Helianthus annuus]KAJ0884644.1 hypothetical protein HanPSC8_Chr10g0436181 [Helianthus annuus]
MLTESQGPHHNAINRLIFRLVVAPQFDQEIFLSETHHTKDLARYATFSCCVELSDHPSLGVVAFTWTSHSS